MYINISEDFNNLLRGEESYMVSKLTEIFDGVYLYDEEIIAMAYMINRLSLEGFIYGISINELYADFSNKYRKVIIDITDFNNVIEQLVENRLINKESIRLDAFDKNIDYTGLHTYTLNKYICNSLYFAGIIIDTIFEEDLMDILLKSSSDIILKNIKDPSNHGRVISKYNLDEIRAKKIQVYANGTRLNEEEFLEYLEYRNATFRRYTFRNCNNSKRLKKDLTAEYIEDMLLSGNESNCKSYGRAEGLRRRNK